ncbi:MAG: serine hydrolase domain-containing protein [Alphaproteobacteria bacterium]
MRSSRKFPARPFERFLFERLFKPLGMKDTFYTVPAEKLDRLSAAYRPTKAGLEEIETWRDSPYALKPFIPGGGTGLVSSARDYARFMAMLLHEGELNGVRVMKTQTAQLMMSNLMEPAYCARDLWRYRLRRGRIVDHRGSSRPRGIGTLAGLVHRTRCAGSIASTAPISF